MLVGPIYVRTIITKLILYLKLVFLMAIVLVIKVTNVLIQQQVKYLLVDMLFLMNLSSLTHAQNPS